MPPAPAGDKAAAAGVCREAGVVMVNYKGAGDTIAALESLAAARPAPARIVVVDNRSGDDSLERLAGWARAAGMSAATVTEAEAARAAWPAGATTLLLVAADDNHGFGAGVNIGVRALQDACDVVVLLNNDATVAPDFLVPALAALTGDPRIGCAGGTIRYAAPREGIWFAGGEVLLLQGRGRHLQLPDDRVREVTFCTGCYMVLRREAFAAAGTMPEAYFLYQEDVEFCVRLRRAGWRIVHVPASVVYHQVSASAGSRRVRPGTAFLAARNRVWFARRNLPLPLRPIGVLWVLLDEANRALGAWLRGAGEVSRAVLRGLAHGVTRRWPEHGPARPA